MRSAREKYNTIKISHKDRQVMKRISKNSRIILLRYDKGREIAIMDKGKYTDKCMNMLKTKQFCKLQKNTTKFIEIEIQRATRKMKMKFSPKEYLNICPISSIPTFSFFFLKWQIYLRLVFSIFSSYLHVTEEPRN